MNEQLTKIVKSRWFEPSVGAVAGLAVGLGVGYILGRRQGQIVVGGPTFENIKPNMDLDLNELNRLAAENQLRNELAKKPTRLVMTEEEASEILKNKKTDKTTENVDANSFFVHDPESLVEPDVVAQSVFANDDTWDYEEELKNRNKDQPYTIHRDEFFTEESGYTQSTLTYYAGDNIMCDSENAPVYNYETVTGPLRFGHGSNDPNVVYVRNDRRQAEYEILLDNGMYSVEVLGLEIENNQRARDLKHSTPRFRME